MKLTPRTLIDSIESLNKLTAMPMSAKSAYWLAKQMKKISAELALIDDQRVKLFEKYGEQNEQGRYEVTVEKIPDFNAEFNGMVDVEIDLDIQTIPLGYIADLQMSVNDMTRLEWLIEDKETT